MKLSKSERINKCLDLMNIRSLKDALYHLPRKYEDLRLTHENNLVDKERIVFKGKLLGDVSTRRFNNITVSKFCFVTSLNNVFFVEAWNRSYLAKILKNEIEYVLIGNYDVNKNKINLINIIKYNPDDKYLKSIYSLPSLMDNYEFSKLINKALKEVSRYSIDCIIPDYLMNKYRLIDKFDALKLVHQPSSYDDIKNGLRTLKYEECLSFCLRTLTIREQNKNIINSGKTKIDFNQVKRFIDSLPYKLTNDQLICVREIMRDMNNQKLMYRLLQGDVGSGKTLVSFIALFANYIRHNQGALMVPTDALAKQHYKNAIKLFSKFNVRIALLCGSSSLKDRAAIRSGLINNEIDIIIGTHVLFSKDINYSSLGLVIIDEQHKFGVNQRKLLLNKGDKADLLTMSATPIPRSLALTLYGDMDISSINELPIKNKNITTKIVEDKQSVINEYIDEAISNHNRVFIVAPMIFDDNSVYSVEKLYSIYLRKYPGKVALLHGKLDQDEKDFALKDFLSGKCPLLVTTSVIEVGIDVPNASLMIIYNPHRFGLASLHQLRGRIGRDGTKSICLLVDDNSNDDTKLDILEKSNNGFEIAEEDLKSRGPGELIGNRQSGMPNFTFVNIINDFKMFQAAKEDAKEMIAKGLYKANIQENA